MNGQECKAVAGCGLYIIRSGDVFNFMVSLSELGWQSEPNVTFQVTIKSA